MGKLFRKQHTSHISILVKNGLNFPSKHFLRSFIFIVKRFGFGNVPPGQSFDRFCDSPTRIPEYFRTLSCKENRASQRAE
ncbi:hypothetical protein BV346_05367 [Pseudomonas syringae pv. actinidiae]|nr:hypothetical protein BV345_05377 [Pseudomonas syringae pv. actinidiae]OSN44498.1 hypothetical protein BV346_05367 [Pseudomonas syringae pv. actinidiae]